MNHLKHTLEERVMAAIKNRLLGEMKGKRIVEVRDLSSPAYMVAVGLAGGEENIVSLEDIQQAVYEELTMFGMETAIPEGDVSVEIKGESIDIKVAPRLRDPKIIIGGKEV